MGTIIVFSSRRTNRRRRIATAMTVCADSPATSLAYSPNPSPTETATHTANRRRSFGDKLQELAGYNLFEVLALEEIVDLKLLEYRTTAIRTADDSQS